MTARPLSRAAGDGRPAAPVGLIHRGLRNFFRAHQAWYTERAPDADQWGIAAFAGRGNALAEAMAPQDALYTLITRAADGDRFQVIGSVSRAHRADDPAAWREHFSAPRVTAATITVTEAGYLRGPGGGLDRDHPAVRADTDALRRDRTGGPVRSAPRRLVAAARRVLAALDPAVAADGQVVAAVATSAEELAAP